jgi:hypothetical protein
MIWSSYVLTISVSEAGIITRRSSTHVGSISPTQWLLASSFFSSEPMCDAVQCRSSCERHSAASGNEARPDC